MIDLRCGRAEDLLPSVPDASVDLVLSDPPYPCIKRPYGIMTEAEWTAMMHEVVRQSRRVLKPHGSAVFILQPNSRKVGSMRGWLWEFMAWCCREWNMVQDVYWWNFTALPTAPAIQGKLTRPSLKYCVWLADRNCYRDQESVLWNESQRSTARRIAARAGKQLTTKVSPSGFKKDDNRAFAASVDRGGVTPFNVLPFDNSNPYSSAGANGHGAGTPEPLCSWWIRYLSRPGDTVLDPFVGSGTVALSALKLGRNAIGFDKEPDYIDIANRRIAAAEAATPLFGTPAQFSSNASP